MWDSLRRWLEPWGGMELTPPNHVKDRDRDRDARLDALELEQREIRARLRLLEIQGSPRGEVS